MKTTKNTKPQTLPDKPSALILLALRDLAKVERQKTKFVVNMSSWVERLNGKCAVCLAGSVMVSTLRVPLPKMVNGEVWPEDGVSDKLFALNHFRMGQIGIAFYELGIDKPDAIPDAIDVVHYNTSGTLFKRDMRKMAAMLARHGQ